MRAAVWEGRDELRVKEVPTPVPGPGELLLKVRRAGVCATDYHVISGRLKLSLPPQIPGHEICGTVAALGPGTAGPPVGTRCVVMTSIGCGHCRFCREGRQYLCAEGSEIGYTPHAGGYAEYVRIPAACALPLPDAVSDEQAGILESAVCPAESLLRTGLKEGSTVLIVGAGPAGLVYAMVAKLLGAARVISLVRRPHKNDLLRRCGADDIVDGNRPDAFQRVLELTGGEGADLCVDAAGAPSVTEFCLSCARRGGTVLVYGIPGEGETFAVPAKELVTRELIVRGAVGNTMAWRPLLAYMAEGRLDLAPLITHRFPLARIDEAFDLYRRRDPQLVKAEIFFDD